MTSKTMSTYASTYVCEQLFSLMNLNKSRFRYQLTDANLNSTLIKLRLYNLSHQILACL